MGLFDFVGDLTELAVKTVVELPTIPINIVKGTISGVEQGIEKISESLD